MASTKETDEKFMDIALEEAAKGYNEGGIPIGAALVSATGELLGRGHNMRIQRSSAILHGEMSALESAGRLPGTSYKGATIYTTLSPCSMCTGAMLLYGIKRVVMGENRTFLGAEEWLEKSGVEIVNLERVDCRNLMKRFIMERPEVWDEDIGK